MVKSIIPAVMVGDDRVHQLVPDAFRGCSPWSAAPTNPRFKVQVVVKAQTVQTVVKRDPTAHAIAARMT